MPRIPLDLRAQPIRRMPAPLLPPGHGQAAAKAGVDIARDIGNQIIDTGRRIARASEQIQAHAKEARRRESQLDMSALQARAAAKLQATHVAAAGTTNRHDIDRLYEDTLGAIEDMADGENERGVPNLRWAEARDAWRNWWTVEKERANARHIQRLRALAAQEDSDRLEAGLTDCVAAAHDTADPDAVANMKARAAELIAGADWLPEGSRSVLLQRTAREIAEAHAGARLAGLEALQADDDTMRELFSEYRRDLLEGKGRDDLSEAVRERLVREAQRLEESTLAQRAKVRKAAATARKDALVDRVTGALGGPRYDAQALITHIAAAEAAGDVDPQTADKLRKAVWSERLDRTPLKTQALLVNVADRLRLGKLSWEDAEKAVLAAMPDATPQDTGRILGFVRAYRGDVRSHAEAQRKVVAQRVGELQDLGALGGRVIDDNGHDVTDRERRKQLADAKSAAARAALQANFDAQDRVYVDLQRGMDDWLKAHPEATDPEIREELDRRLAPILQKAAAADISRGLFGRLNQAASDAARGAVKWLHEDSPSSSAPPSPAPTATSGQGGMFGFGVY